LGSEINLMMDKLCLQFIGMEKRIKRMTRYTLSQTKQFRDELCIVFVSRHVPLLFLVIKTHYKYTIIHIEYIPAVDPNIQTNI
jgi:hypothetical protein